MNKQQTHRILIGCVALIWATVLWRYIFSQEKTSQTQAPIQVSTAAYNSSDVADSFTLDLDYPDPFLGSTLSTPGQGKPPKGEGVVSRQQLGRVVSLAPRLRLPNIRFHGWVDKADAQGGRALVSIEGNIWSLQAGDERGGIQIEAIQMDELLVRFADSTYIIPRQ